MRGKAEWPRRFFSHVRATSSHALPGPSPLPRHPDIRATWKSRGVRGSSRGDREASPLFSVPRVSLVSPCAGPFACPSIRGPRQGLSGRPGPERPRAALHLLLTCNHSHSTPFSWGEGRDMFPATRPWSSEAPRAVPSSVTWAARAPVPSQSRLAARPSRTRSFPVRGSPGCGPRASQGPQSVRQGFPSP